MTPKQILDSFSATLIQDDRILSAQERDLLASLLQHTKTIAGEDQRTRATVQKVISAAVGETVAQRAFTILGGSIVERILESSPTSYDSTETARTPVPSPPQPPDSGGAQPQPVREQPQPPTVSVFSGHPRPMGMQPQPPTGQPQQPQPPTGQPQPPSSGQPQPPNVRASIAASAAVAVTTPEVLPAKCVVLDEFLSPQELEELTRFTIEHEADFRTSEVVSPVSEKGVINYEHRRSRLLFEVGPHEDVILNRIKAVLPKVIDQMGMEEFLITGTEVQITASNDGDFFRFHNDNGSDKVASRSLTFVYFFHREPQPFEGGELRIHDARREGEIYVSDGSYRTITPRQNQIVFFPCELMHEVTAVKCPSRLFADSRFTLNGWLRR